MANPGMHALPFDDGPLAGATTEAAKEFEPTELIGPAAAAPEVRLPRPSTIRLPIDAAAFAELKARARTDKDAMRGRKKLLRDTSPAGGPPGVASANAPGGLAAPAAPAASGAPAAAPAAPAPPTLVQSYAGNPHTGWLPYDCALAVGIDHVLAAVNSSVAILAKGGGAALRMRSLGSWFGSVAPGATVFDPRLAYDADARRWILAATAYDAAERSWFLLSVSKTADPMGIWYNYALDAKLDGTKPTNNWADYPGLACDDQAIYLTANMFAFGGGFSYVKLRVVDKAKVYSGGTASYRDFVGLRNADGSLAFTVQPCTRVAGGGPQYLVNSRYPTTSDPQPDDLTLWTLTGAPDAPSLARATVATDPYAIPPDATQPGGAAPLDSGDIRLLTAAQGASVWTCLTTRQTWDDGTNAAAVYWIEIDPGAAGGPAVRQDAVYGAAGRHYLYPAITPDPQGNAILAFARVGPTENAGLHLASRRHGDAPSTLSSSVLVHAGTGPYTGFDSGGRNRWGDYLGVATDPADPSQLWAYGGYAATATTWAAWIAAAQP